VYVVYDLEILGSSCAKTIILEELYFPSPNISGGIFMLFLRYLNDAAASSAAKRHLFISGFIQGLFLLLTPLLSSPLSFSSTKTYPSYSSK
jgi:hypothetical protein